MRPYATAFGMSALRSIKNPGFIVIRALFFSVILIVFMALWKAAMQSANGSIAGYTFSDILWYLMATETAVVSVPHRRIEDIGDAISSGAYETELLRPVSAAGIRIATELGQAVVTLAVLYTWGAALITTFVGPPNSLTCLLLGIPAVILAVSCDWIALHAFGAIAFWVGDTRASWFLLQKLVFVLGAMLLPLQFLPHAMQVVAWALPFLAMAYIPGRIVSGHLEAWLLLVQLAWLVVLSIATRQLFAIGERRLRAGA